MKIFYGSPLTPVNSPDLLIVSARAVMALANQPDICEAISEVMGLAVPLIGN